MVAVDGNFPNTFQTPNAFVDDYMILLTKDEALCLFVAAREILGWRDKRLDKKARISLSQFQRSIPTSRGAISKALKSLCQYRLLSAVGKPTSDGQEYEITAVVDDKAIDLDGLKARQAVRLQKTQRKTDKARAASVAKAKAKAAEKEAVCSTDQPESQSVPQTSGLSDRPDSSLYNRPTGGLSDRHNETNDQTHLLNQEDKDSGAHPAAPIVADPPTPAQVETAPKPKRARATKPKVEKPKTPRDPDPAFDVIAERLFNAPPGSPALRDRNICGRVGMVKSALHDAEIIIGEFLAACDWYKRTNPGISLPRDPGKAVTMVLDYRAGHKADTEVIYANGMTRAQAKAAAAETIAAYQGEDPAARAAFDAIMSGSLS